MNGRELATALRSGQKVYGYCVTSTSPQWLGIASGLKLDFVFIDTEHIPIDRIMLSWMCQVYRAQNVAPIVRIPSPDPYQACMVLDGGASGVIAPYLESVEQVRKLRGAVKVRPLKGRRLENFLEERADLEPKLLTYLRDRNVQNVMIINVESVPALESLDALLAVPDLDAVLIGPHDLSCSLGVPEQYDHPKFMNAVSTIIRKARAAGVGIGIHYSEGIEKEIGWAREGANFIVHSSDLSAARGALRAEFDALRNAIETSSAPKQTPGAAGEPEKTVI
ncbi:MAG: aldolase [Candidatus Hydrogenedentes bacterium]|nr:aldolase [Candidatus Hydrogenedentota bacterium]